MTTIHFGPGYKPVTLAEWERNLTRKTTLYTPVNTVNAEPILNDPSDEEVLLLAKYNIAKLEPKFRAGMEKYDTPIYQKSGLKEMLPELLDLIAYHSVAQLQWSRVHRLLDELCLEKPGLDRHPLVMKMFEILGDKPLAVKRKEKKKKQKK